MNHMTMCNSPQIVRRRSIDVSKIDLSSESEVEEENENISLIAPVITISLYNSRSNLDHV